MESLTSYLNREKSKQEMSKSLIARRRILRSKRSGTKSFFAFWPRVNWSESKKRRSGVGGAREGTLARKSLDFEKLVRPRTGFLIGAAWSS